MLVTTTNTIEGKRISRYFGIVSGETIIGANVFRDFMAGIRDFFGGRSGSYEKVLREAKETALQEMQQQAQRPAGPRRQEFPQADRRNSCRNVCLSREKAYFCRQKE